MLEPIPKKRNRVTDVLLAIVILCSIVLGLWLCSRSDKLMTPDESDCIQQLRAMTHRMTNYTEEEVLLYGRCLVDRRM